MTDRSFMLREMLVARNWRRASRLPLWMVVLVLALAPHPGAAQVSTTTVQGTVYEANGQPASGTMLISWPAFTTEADQAVAAGSTSVVIGSDGFASVQLAPNQNASPAGTYYTVVYHLADGTVNREYWVVPAAATAALGSVRVQIEPATVAVQSASKNYVDSSIASLGGTYVSKTGGTMTGPLTLAGDPTSDLQAVTKRYADNLAASELPLTGGSVEGVLQVSSLIQKGPKVDVTDSDFGFGQPVAGIAITNGACTSAPTVSIPPPQYSQDGSQATAAAYCVNGQVEIAINFPGGGYTPAQIPIVSGGGTSGATASLILAGTAGPADPTGKKPSLAALENAVDYAYSHAETAKSVAEVYVPQGIYAMDGTLRVPCDASLEGDGMTATILEPTINQDNGITVYPISQHPDAWDCRGSISKLEINAPGGHLYTATELSILSSAGFTLNDVDVSGGGGRGINTQAGTERTYAGDIEIDTVRWPLIWYGNEQHIKKLNIAVPGASGDTVLEPDGGFGFYCFGTGNCVNGVYPSNKWNGGSLIYASGMGL